MIKKIIGAVIILGGILGAVLAATADMTGLNVTQDNPDFAAFGWLQITLTIVGGVIFLFGLVFMVVIAMKKPAEEEEEQAPAPAADAGTVAPTEEVAAAPAAQDLYGGQDLYASSPPVKQPAVQETYEETAYAQQAQPDYQDDAVDFSAGAAETPAEESQPDDLLDDLDGLDGLEDLAEDLGEGGGGESYECPDCGAQLTSNATSCSECGAEFSEEIFECPVCGAEVPEDAGECPKCGEEFEDDDEEF